MKVKSESEVAQSCLTLCDPMDCSLPASSVHGIFQARVLEWGAIAFSEAHLPRPCQCSRTLHLSVRLGELVFPIAKSKKGWFSSISSTVWQTDCFPLTLLRKCMCSFHDGPQPTRGTIHMFSTIADAEGPEADTNCPWFLPGVVTTAAMGKPFPIPLAMVTISGRTSCVWKPQK